jgi:hypothetical protein
MRPAEVLWEWTGGAGEETEEQHSQVGGVPETREESVSYRE